ncbi:nuclear transport factor 2 family protein [Leeia oryzae]|uniref:nuclear transport factor 2 family protein n=1 Tax=Leeia oryzae TaxID=356662 RepID=UPI0012E9F961|nr:nuclear transport factor 2 family protein [Leeia oryzae]
MMAAILKELCERYLDALNQGDLAAVMSLFTEDAVIKSPLYGEMPASTFYRDLFADTTRSVTTLKNVFTQSTQVPAVALHFSYQWTLKSGKQVAFECVDVFELSDSRDRFRQLTIIYDTAHLREDFYQSSARQ